MSVGTGTAATALAKLHSFRSSGFYTIVLDERGRELTLDQLEAEAANEARALSVEVDASIAARQAQAPSPRVA